MKLTEAQLDELAKIVPLDLLGALRSGAVREIVESITPGTFHHQRSVGDLYGWCERTRAALVALIEERDRLKVERDGVPYGIIDPDYARVFTIARCIAWSEGYALVMHGSFTRDLDLLAVPWEDRATDAEHLVKRIATALDDLDILVKDAGGKTASQKPHGRLSWTLTFKAFGDPRFIDLSVMPRAAKEERP